MHDMLYHETLYRGDAALARLSNTRLTMCGAGAVGSNLVPHLVRQGVRTITVIDFDRVEAHNVGTKDLAVSLGGTRRAIRAGDCKRVKLAKRVDPARREFFARDFLEEPPVKYRHAGLPY